ncbi:DNA-entry nuclease [Lacticaseibacillus camelliae DSM 22697 = JCM 13995]|uniref:DNA-entry nuclease n=1 Tax=Lacticaseibacillus camelliae DSM 22697 = JCM 13995 TaxID=1423730 RepID=A0A0R2FKG0_9LACO|nr:DNA/RNA non-specific endonuclease [Lacticaseibacillus camelliae]KRN25132.1 DNA-entry nuclease [Lacticaseibacillus camelliae DSM 22697 = JCM 13995]
MGKNESSHRCWQRLLKTAAALTVVLSLGTTTLTACGSDSSSSVTTSQKQKTKPDASQKAAKEKARKEAAQKKRAAAKAKEKAAKEAAAKKAALAKAAAAKAKTTAEQNLANLSYHGTQTIDVNGGKPTFTAADLSTQHGTWQRFADLDGLNRATDAEALMNKAMMPTAEREPLTWDPTGWHNKKLKSGYLYNRSHLIGYQLTGQNNNPKNLMTGTRSLNSPEMLRFEDDIAYFMKTNPSAYVRYSVRPVYKGNNLLASGVHMMAEDVGASGLSFNVYIFNVEDGVTINYADGTSVVSASESAPAGTTQPASGSTTNASAAPASGAAHTTTQRGDMNTASAGKIVGNRNSHIYHVPGQSGYRMNSSNAVYFDTEQQAQAAGYRKALR